MSGSSNQSKLSKGGKPNPSKKGASNAKFAKKGPSLVQQLKAADLTEAIVEVLFDKIASEYLRNGQETSISSIGGNFELVFRGRDLREENKHRKAYTDGLLKLQPDQVAGVAKNNPEWDQAYKTWKRTPTMSKAKQLLGVDPAVNEISAVAKWGKLTYFRPPSAQEETTKATKARRTESVDSKEAEEEPSDSTTDQ